MGERASDPASDRTDGPAPALLRFLSRGLTLLPPNGTEAVEVDDPFVCCDRESDMLLLPTLPPPPIPFDEPVSRERREERRVGGAAPTEASRRPLTPSDGTPRTTRRPLAGGGGLLSSSLTGVTVLLDAAAPPARVRLTPGAMVEAREAVGGVKSEDEGPLELEAKADSDWV